MKPGVVINLQWNDNEGPSATGMRTDAGGASVALNEPEILAVMAQLIQVAMLTQAEGMRKAQGPQILRATGPVRRG